MMTGCNVLWLAALDKWESLHDLDLGPLLWFSGTGASFRLCPQKDHNITSTMSQDIPAVIPSLKI